MAGTDGGGVYVLAHSTANWTAVNTGLTNPHIHTLVVVGTDLFAGTVGSGVWKRSLLEVSVRLASSELPREFNLQQNYPNPFNPTTRIDFQIPRSSQVSVVVFDMLGREVAVLVDEKLSVGSYSTQWSAAGFASGVYLCRLQAGEFVQTRKLLLLR
jgi:hypothetical protein